MPLIKDGQLAEDTWTAVADDETFAVGADIIVSLERWQAEREILSRRPGRLGLRLRSDQSPTLVAEDLHHFDLVALEFPKFTDGRSYSHARLLRDRYAFAGELRAVGQVLRDQFVLMLRCGFDSLEVAEPRLAGQWEQAISEIGGVYQGASDRQIPAWALRGGHGGATAGVAGSWAY